MITRATSTHLGRRALLILLASLASAAFAGVTSRFEQDGQGKGAGFRPTPTGREMAPSQASSRATAPLLQTLQPQPTIPQRSVPAWATNANVEEIVVKLKKGTKGALLLQDKKRGLKGKLADVVEAAQLGPVFSKHGISSMTPAFGRARNALKTALKGKSASKRDDLFRWCRVPLPKGADRQKLLADLKSHPDVELAEPAYEWRLQDDIDPPIIGLPDGTTDPLMDDQWHHTAAHSQAAWNHLTNSGSPMGGMHDVVVAVIDTGVDYNHEELVGNMWNNPDEIPGNNLDDDHNGFTNDVHGCSVTSDARSHSGDPIDLHGHGTHVAGIIAATAYNHKGGVGVAFNVQIMAIRAAQYSGTLTTTDISEGILYAVDNGAEVINMSFGGYQRSQIVEDALEVALSQAVLVAAAGNDGLNAWIVPCYPAALPYVHGVMATTPAGKLAWFSNYGYDMAAPGQSILSTLPGNQYAAWSGTSMAAPIVSGAAALMRSFFWQREIYSSRFLMGSLSQNGLPLNIYKALTEPPQPGVSMLENWLFDTPSISPNNNSNGIVNSGETIHIAIEAINRAGTASNVVASLVAQAQGAMFPDPYVTLVVSNVDFGNMGPWNITDNGFIYDAQGVITGVSRPFVFTVAPDCPNDHVIPFELTFTFYDGWNPGNPGPYTRVTRFNYPVVRGRDLPTVISTNMELTAQDYWIVKGPVLIEPGATVTIRPGTQVQWGGISDDPYNPGPQNGNVVVRGNLLIEGTSDQPVSLFPSYLVAGQLVTITVEGGSADMAYVKVRNPNLTGLRTIDHGYFERDLGASTITATVISNSVFHKFRGGGTLSASYYNRCLFDAGWLAPSGTPQLFNCTFLQDNENNNPLSLTAPKTTDKSSFGGVFYKGEGVGEWYGIRNVVVRSNQTYALLPVDHTSILEPELIAQYFGGHVASIPDQTEQSFLESYITEAGHPQGNIRSFIGMTDEGHPGNYRWLDGCSMSFANWASNYPTALPTLTKHVVNFSHCQQYETPWLGTWKNVEAGPAQRGYFSGYDIWHLYILKLPGEWTEAQLNAPVASGELLTYVRERMRGDVLYNAFLSKYWDPNVLHWMRIRTLNTSPRRTYSAMYDNYWGTGSTTLIDHAILDYYDDFVSSVVDYQPPPTNGFTTTYPFAQGVVVNGANLESVPTLESGRADFSVTFNRDMNTNVEPFVSFGPSPPHTDFQVTPRDNNFVQTTNGWLDARTWVGSAWITPVTGNGYHLMRISGAVAADDPWLVTGYDVGRFRFRVATTEVASMALQAEGLEGAIHLMWQQNDYSLLAGYNLYRSTNAAGTYVKLNSTVIGPTNTSYMDTNVTPAVPMFYKFTVLSTDFQESDASGMASAAALDTIAPKLTHTAVSSALPSQGLHLTAVATDNLRVVGVTAYYRPTGGSNYTAMPMVNVSTTNWSVTIPGSAVQSPGLEYYITVTDGISEVFSGTPVLPHVVLVSNIPSLGSVTPNQGPGEGGTVVTLSGTLFEPGVSVLFGGVPASSVTLLTANQLTCVTPPHFPALVDVTVVNTNGTQSTLLNAFRFEQTGVVVALPVTNGNYGNQVEIALSAANVAGLRAVDVTITWDSSVLSAASAGVGTLTAGWGLVANFNTPGRAVLSLASSSSVTGSGSLALLRLNIVKAPPASTTLVIQSVSLNDGAMTATRSDGSFTVNGFFTLAGTVRYFLSTNVVPDVSLDLVGAGAFQTMSATDGGFSITNIPTGSYVLTPTKTNQVLEITGYDASLVLQAAAGLLTLSANQILAADVNRNGSVSAMDASYILEKAVGLIEGAFPGTGRLWDFTPAQRSYSLLNSDLTGQDFTAVLIGDVSGNWAPPAEPAGAPPSPAGKGAEGEVSKSDGESPSSVVIGTDNGPLPDALGQTNGRVLLKASEASVYGIDLVLSYTPTNRTVAEVRRGGLAEGMALAANTNQAGVVRASLATAAPLSGSGSLLLVSFAGSDPVTWQIDQVRVNEGQVPVILDPTLTAFDTDGDGLIDVDEVEVFHTNPVRRDTDGDGVADGAEARAGTDPLGKDDVFAVVRADAVGGLTRVVWTVKANKIYQVLKSLDLRSWTNAPNGPSTDQQSLRTAVTDGLLNYLDPATATSGTGTVFYRIRLVE